MDMHTMGSEEIIKVRDLTKLYRFYKKPLHRLKEFFVREKKHTEFFALNHVNFSVTKGETLGVIGENGAGKSTLLQLIAGTLSPTSGEIMVNGRVLALLELGIGFHPDFTGKENIFFYGDILGFPRGFIQSKFNEIVEFSELGGFIDRPLKTYSTGMQMRLAFSLISSLEPDILIIDEVLSVGDVHFQKKCIDRIMDFKNKGKTIIFCSHSSYHVDILCNNVIWLKDGRIEMSGEPGEVLPAYEYYQLQKEETVNEQQGEDYAPIMIRELRLLNAQPLKRGDNMGVTLLIESKKEHAPYHVTLSIKVNSSRGVFLTGTHMRGMNPLSGRMNRMLVTFPKIPLLGGFYYFHARIFDGNGFVLIHEKVSPPFEVLKDSLERGVCALENHWDIKKPEDGE
jgi:homopolymeric O-antigen transport system ATP-binding protein